MKSRITKERLEALKKIGRFEDIVEFFFLKWRISYIFTVNEQLIPIALGNEFVQYQHHIQIDVYFPQPIEVSNRVCVAKLLFPFFRSGINTSNRNSF